MVPNTFIRYPTDDPTPGDERRVRLFVFIYLASSAGLFRKCHFSIEQLLRMMLVKTPQRKLKTLQIYETLITTLDWFVQSEYIESPARPFREFEVWELITVDVLYAGLSIDGYSADGKYRSKESFTKITMYEFYILTERANSRVALLDLSIYSYIKSLIFHRRQGTTIEEHAECCYLSYQQLQDACLVSRDALRRSLEFLQNSELIDFNKPDNIEKYEIDGKLYRATGKFSNLKTVFVINRPGYETELQAGVNNYIRENQKSFKYIGGDN